MKGQEKIYMMNKLITGETKKEQEPVAVRDPRDNCLIVVPEKDNIKVL